MLKSLWIKIPTLAIPVLVLSFFDGPVAWLVSAVAITLGLLALAWVVCNARSSFFARTLWRAQGSTNSVAITFDDGPDPRFTRGVLDILAERQVPAAFFVVGDRVRAHPELLERMHAEGHIVGNHTDSHEMLFHCRLWGLLRREVEDCNAAIQSVIGRVPSLFRPPMGFKNPALGDVLKAASMTNVGWQVRGCDAVSKDPSEICARIDKGIRPGGVILLHDGPGLGGKEDLSATLDALPVIIDRLRERGFQFVRLDALLGVEPYRKLKAS